MMAQTGVGFATLKSELEPDRNYTMKYYQKWMIDELARRQSKNANYSTRAFAKHLQVSPSLVSRVINGSMEISHKIAPVIIKNSEMTDDDASMFIDSVLLRLKEEMLDINSPIPEDIGFNA
jgi:hypothetical protein